MLASYDVLDLTDGARVTLLLVRRFISGDVTFQCVRGGYVIRVIGFRKPRFFPFISLRRFFFSFLSCSLVYFLLLLLLSCFPWLPPEFGS